MFIHVNILSRALANSECSNARFKAATALVAIQVGTALLLAPKQRGRFSCHVCSHASLSNFILCRISEAADFNIKVFLQKSREFTKHSEMKGENEQKKGLKIFLYL